jgi:hypothetical protein
VSVALAAIPHPVITRLLLESLSHFAYACRTNV